MDEQSPIPNSPADLTADCILLAGALDQYRAESLKEQLLAAIEPSDNEHQTVLDMTTVDHLDASCLQVLLAYKPARTQNKLEIKGLPQSIRQWIRIAGADELFEFASDND